MPPLPIKNAHKRFFLLNLLSNGLSIGRVYTIKNCQRTWTFPDSFLKKNHIFYVFIIFPPLLRS